MVGESARLSRSHCFLKVKESKRGMFYGVNIHTAPATSLSKHREPPKSHLAGESATTCGNQRY